MINLGDKVEDTITGFSGIAIARHIFLFTIESISVQPLVNNYGILPEVENFAARQLKVIEEKPKLKVTGENSRLKVIKPAK